ncbi:sensor histidine kinase [Alkalilimnicola sp. S0819]|uniref:sensor histidine kinase n=1 Tax=Alkalilimnicola sp. S0819 TaxID=2613922 RepID=UPI00186A0198|nr:sensor histidine kinase [Alkalilimnicola sp. S0819]
MKQRWLFRTGWALVLLLAGGLAQGQPLRLGADLPFHEYEDHDAALDLQGFLALPEAALTRRERVLSAGYTRSALWLRLRLPAEQFGQGERWLRLGPNYVDELTVYFRPLGSQAPWERKELGDTAGTRRGDLDSRTPVVVLPAPANAPGYEVVIRAASTSAVLVDGGLWTPANYADAAAADTAGWSFYFGLVSIGGAMALLLALISRTRLLWSVFLFSSSGLLVACVQGFVHWLWGAQFPLLQHYLTSVLTLLAYSSLLWMCSEALEFRRNAPRLYRFLLGVIALNLLMQLSIPLDFYHLAVKLQGVIMLLVTPLFTAGALRLWWREGVNVITLVLGIAPLLYVLTALLALGSLFGLIPYYAWLYGVWQYVALVNMLLVLGLAIWRIREENRQSLEKQHLARQLHLEREAASRQRHFIGLVSHEFRTPLAVISGALENLALPGLSEGQRGQRHSKIRSATERLIQLTDNFLADARLSSDKLYLNPAPVDLIGLIRESAVMVALSEQHELRLRLNGKDLPSPPSAVGAAHGRESHLVEKGLRGHEPLLHVQADAGLLRIALSNLFDNAAKYAPGGPVVVELSEEAGRFLVRIRDFGPGIPEAQAARVFERYRRAEAGAANARGAGLGLHVARQIILAHGGDLRLERRLGPGCSFLISLPRHVEWPENDEVTIIEA